MRTLATTLSFLFLTNCLPNVVTQEYLDEYAKRKILECIKQTTDKICSKGKTRIESMCTHIYYRITIETANGGNDILQGFIPESFTKRCSYYKEHE